MFDVRALVDKYAHLHKAYYKHKPQYLRPFLARSDPARHVRGTHEISFVHTVHKVKQHLPP